MEADVSVAECIQDIKIVPKEDVTLDAENETKEQMEMYTSAEVKLEAGGVFCQSEAVVKVMLDTDKINLLDFDALTVKKIGSC